MCSLFYVWQSSAWIFSGQSIYHGGYSLKCFLRPLKNYVSQLRSKSLSRPRNHSVNVRVPQVTPAYLFQYLAFLSLLSGRRMTVEEFESKLLKIWLEQSWGRTQKYMFSFIIFMHRKQGSISHVTWMDLLPSSGSSAVSYLLGTSMWSLLPACPKGSASSTLLFFFSFPPFCLHAFLASNSRNFQREQSLE